MQINLTQVDVDLAVRNYIVSMGITRDIGDIAYTQTRQGNKGITAEIELSDPDSPSAPAPVVASKKAEAKKAPIKEALKEVASEKVEEKVASPEPEVEATAEAEVNPKKSIFG